MIFSIDENLPKTAGSPSDNVLNEFRLFHNNSLFSAGNVYRAIGFDATQVKILIFLLFFIVVNLIAIKISWQIYGSRIIQTLTKSAQQSAAANDQNSG